MALKVLGAALQPPFRLLYVLHTSRCDAPLGRYESPDLDGPDVEAFFQRFGPFLAEDARHDIWLHSRYTGGPVVLDRYNMVYAYGPLDAFAGILTKGGIPEVAEWAAPTVPYPHALHYHSQFDPLEAALLAHLSWHRKPLHPEDVQYWSGPQAR